MTTIQDTEDRGRVLVATKAYRAGDVVLVDEPFQSMLLMEKVESLCSRCYRHAPAGTALLRCSSCRRSMYCTKDCQKLDWRDGHKLECKATDGLWSTLSPRDVSDALLVGRAVRRVAASPDAPASVALMALPSNADHAAMKTATAKAKRARIVSAVMRGGLAGTAVESEVDTMLCRFQCNNFGVVDDLLMPVAAAVYPGGASLNHSCYPTCVRDSWCLLGLLCV